MKRIEIISHCYCPPGVDIYAEFLRWQFSSLIRYTPKDVCVTWTVCYAHRQKDDPATYAALDRIFDLSSDVAARLDLNPLPLPLGSLFRRAIGRNKALLATKADICWLTDIDYLAAPGFLAGLAEHVQPDGGLYIPSHIWISKSHAEGQRVVDSARQVDLPDIPFDTFAKRRQKLAIGGVQICDGDTARRIGYLGRTKWTEPVDPTAGFRSCRCDRAWRRHNKLSATSIPVEGCYRLRHESDGRDYDLTGTKRGKEVW